MTMLTLAGLMNYDDTILDDLVLPEGMDLEMAKEILHRAGLEPKRIFAAMSDGGYMEMTL